MNEIVMRLGKLRNAMKESGADWFFCSSDDYHGSEYVADYFKVREHFTGFTGENAFLIVGSNEALMWTDGRFFIQAEIQLMGTGIELMKMDEPGVPTINEFVEQNVKEGQTLLFDGRMVSYSLGQKICERVEKNGGSVVYTKDIVDSLWDERPSRPESKVQILSNELTGEKTSEKLQKIRSEMKKLNCEYHFIASLDDIAWITNLRGKDIECNPVFLSYMLISDEKAVIFMQKNQVTNEISDYLCGEGIEIEDYDEVFNYLEGIEGKKNILVYEYGVNYCSYKLLSQKGNVILQINPSTLEKSVKNETERRLLFECYLRDSVCVIKFIYWLKNIADVSNLTENDASDYLDGLRRKVSDYLDLSFPTIAGYADNGAIIHYTATKESNKKLEKEGFLLVDSGGQYLTGTTDVTRTIALGKLTDKMKLHYTKIAIGMLSLADAKFISGCTGRNLDILARKPLWELGLDYRHGTGHGIGHVLNVHEGPQSFRWKYNERSKEYPLKPGMVTSDEPGLYI